MAALNMQYLEELEKYMESGEMLYDFKFFGQEGRHAILEFLEKLMDLAELADKVATEAIFSDSQLGRMAGVSDKA